MNFSLLNSFTVQLHRRLVDEYICDASDVELSRRGERESESITSNAHQPSNGHHPVITWIYIWILHLSKNSSFPPGSHQISSHSSLSFWASWIISSSHIMIMASTHRPKFHAGCFCSPDWMSSFITHSMGLMANKRDERAHRHRWASYLITVSTATTHHSLWYICSVCLALTIFLLIECNSWHSIFT